MVHVSLRRLPLGGPRSTPGLVSAQGLRRRQVSIGARLGAPRSFKAITNESTDDPKRLGYPPDLGFRPAVVEVFNQKPRSVRPLLRDLVYGVRNQPDILALLERRPVDRYLPGSILLFRLRDDREHSAQPLGREGANTFFAGSRTTVFPRDRVSHLLVARQPHEAVFEVRSRHAAAVVYDLHGPIRRIGDRHRTASRICVISILDQLRECSLLLSDELLP